MGTIDSKLSVTDIQLLIDAMGDWEMNNNQDYHIMQAVKNASIPEDVEDDQYNFIMQIKNHFKQREKEINDKRALRQEQAIILKAKLMLIKNDLGINQLFDDAKEIEKPSGKIPINKVPLHMLPQEPVKPDQNYPNVKLMKAESFLNQEKYARIWELYQSDLNGKPSTLEKIESYINELGMTKIYQKYLEENP